MYESCHLVSYSRLPKYLSTYEGILDVCLYGVHECVHVCVCMGCVHGLRAAVCRYDASHLHIACSARTHEVDVFDTLFILYPHNHTIKGML